MAEGGGLLNRYTVKSCIGGSNPPLSARIFLATLGLAWEPRHPRTLKGCKAPEISPTPNAGRIQICIFS